MHRSNMIVPLKVFVKRMRAAVEGRKYSYVSAFASGFERILSSALELSIIRSLKRHGYFVWEDFLPAGKCADLCKCIDDAALTHESLRNAFTPSNDLRIFGIENIYPEFREISLNPVLLNVANFYLKEPARTAFSLGARLERSDTGLGSGGGWHRDSNMPQIKAMLYLSDVEIDNGPFQLIAHSHRFLSTVKDHMNGGQNYGEVRWAQESIDRVLAASGPGRLHTFPGKAGSLIIFDSSTLHRGAPINAGKRYAVTNYFYPERFIDADLYQHFFPVAGFV